MKYCIIQHRFVKKIAKPLMIYEEVFDILKKKHQKEKSDSSFSKWATDYVLSNLKKEEFVSKYAPHLQLVNSDEKSMLIRDAHLDNKVVEVTLRDNRLWCSECKPKACMHVFYAIARPEIAQLNDLDGKKK